MYFWGAGSCSLHIPNCTYPQNVVHYIFVVHHGISRPRTPPTNEYLVTENRILRNQITGRVRLTIGKRTALTAIGQKLGKKALEEVASLVKPDTILGWQRKLVARSVTAPSSARLHGAPPLTRRWRRWSSAWRARIAPGAMIGSSAPWPISATLSVARPSGTSRSAMVSRRLPSGRRPPHGRNHGTHLEVLVATDFFTAEVWMLGGLVTYYVLFSIHLGSRRSISGRDAIPIAVDDAGRAERHDGRMAFLAPGQYLLHDRDTKFCAAFNRSSMMLALSGYRYRCGHQSQRLRGTLGAIGQRRSTVPDDSVWRKLSAACTQGVCGPLSSRAQSSRQGQHPTFSGIRGAVQQAVHERIQPTRHSLVVLGEPGGDNRSA